MRHFFFSPIGYMLVDIYRFHYKYRANIIEQNMPMIEGFCSDSLSDTPIALLAEKAFIVRDKAQRPEPWPHLNPELSKKIRKKIGM